MKLIFLDIDGVLINREACRRGFGKADSKSVALLNSLTTATGASLVLSSCWRIGKSVPECRELLKSFGVTGSMIDRTPVAHDLTLKRGDEIRSWLYSYPRDISSFIILDDDADMCEFLPRLVQTTFEFGLQRDHVFKAIELLEGEWIWQKTQSKS